MSQGDISIHHGNLEPLRIYGINHFMQKCGIQFSFNTESKINIVYGGASQGINGFNIYISKNELGEGICGHLKIKDEKVPLFEKPMRLDESGDNLVVFVDNKGDEYPCVVLNNTGIAVGFDIFNEVGHILTGYLEHFWKMKENKHEKLAKIPVVDYYEKILFDCLLFASRRLNLSLKYKPFWPDGKKFAVCLTHDVDRVHKSYQYITHFVRNIGRGDFRSAINQITSVARKLHGDEPYWNFDRIMEIERNLGVKSTFFFLNEQKKVCVLPNEWKLYRGRYDIKDKRIVEMIKKLDAEGWEIGVHGSYNSYRDFDMMKEEKETLEEILGKRVHGISQHYCNLEIPSTWEYHEKLGFSYDASLGFVTDIGFRWGTCYPFHPFNPENGRILSLWELPITIMDNACAYKSWQDIMEIINTVEKYNGLLLLRWHQAVFNEREFPGRSKIYERIIKVCKERNAWITNAYSIAEWLTMREKYGKFENPNNQSSPLSAKWT
ncbi:MAG: polysaccharide deacetylase family protein [Candidatus Methanospirare jalkutatii]|nr:polysaccharide deacetylase family protein [Candidatus Methanospirare jalkutatii]